MSENDRKVYTVRLMSLSTSDDDILTQALSNYFKDGDNIVLLGYREDSLLFENEKIELRKRIPEQLESVGSYKVIEFIDDTRFKAIAQIKFSETTNNLIGLAYKYFYTLIVCKTNLNEGQLVDSGCKWFELDVFAEKKVNSDLFNDCFIKGLVKNELYFTFKGNEAEYESMVKIFGGGFKIDKVNSAARKKWKGKNILKWIIASIGG